MAVHRSISVEQNLKIKMPRDIFKILFGRGIGLHPLVTATVDMDRREIWCRYFCV